MRCWLREKRGSEANTILVKAVRGFRPQLTSADRTFADRIRRGFRTRVQLDVPSEAEQAQCPYPKPVQVDLVPGEAMPGRSGAGVMVVVPAFAEAQQRDPEVVGGLIAREEA